MIQSFGKALAKKTMEIVVENCMGGSNVDNMQTLKRNWQELSCKASDVKEEVKREEMSGKTKRKIEVDNWLKEVKYLNPEIDGLETRRSSWRLPLKEDPVRKLQFQVKELIDQSCHFNGLVLHAYDNIVEPCLPTILFGEKVKQNLERIWPCLVTDDISSIGIYGMGGVGKTTLVKHINYYLLQKGYQVLWVTISQEFSIKSLQEKIANVLGVCLSDKDDEVVMAYVLYGAFRRLEKLTVLILDDVWQQFCLHRAGISLDANKCRLILTTRSLEVCDRMQCQRIFEVKILDSNEAWELFMYTLGDKKVLHIDVEEIAKSVAKRCAGLPLGIVTVAGSMRGVTDICEWRNALEQLNSCSIGHDEMERDVFSILEWSFDRLNKYEQKCFLYCCLYPEDCRIAREGLVNLFIREELMPKRSSRLAEFDQGHKILNKLVKVCLLEETTDDRGNECVRMHDLIRDMALRIASGNSTLKISGDVPRFLVKSIRIGNSRVAFEEKEWTEDLHAISIYSIGSAIEIPPGMSPKCPKLSTLLLRSLHIGRIPNTFFKHMSGLKVLDLRHNRLIKELPDCVSNLVSLTALVLQNCIHLQSVPPLGNLTQLKELDLSGSGIEDLPQGLKSLVNLERLDMLKCQNLQRVIIPKGTFSELSCLQQLGLDPYYFVQVNDPEVSNQLEVFTGCLPFNDFYEISRWPKHYTVEFNEFLPEDGYFDHDDEYINGHSQELLAFRQCNFWRGSNNPVLLLPNNVKHLRLVKCVCLGNRCLSDVFKNFTSLKDLSYLSIIDVDDIEFLLKLPSPPPPLHDQLVVSCFNPLQNLQELKLVDLPNLVDLLYWESEPSFLPPATFSSLACIMISKCHKLKQLFTVQLLQGLQNLDDLYVDDCEGLEEIAEDDDGVGRGGEGIQSEATTTVILPKLRRLYLNRLPELNHIWNAAKICKSLQYINVRDCPKMEEKPQMEFPLAKDNAIVCHLIWC
ncbi:probable disease resistance protein At1g61300 isoform X2 [Coffea arabica]|uniref:Probable disease resistance protein At1g61300 isoform X2 n=1 Tax=Coffea arabica TaxID=13443 RepID=A0ABM4UBM0_COFAR|nr:probable disease resistance protein At4g27220 isoform X2 [Coffea arabica]